MRAQTYLVVTLLAATTAMPQTANAAQMAAIKKSMAAKRP